VRHVGEGPAIETEAAGGGELREGGGRKGAYEPAEKVIAIKEDGERRGRGRGRGGEAARRESGGRKGAYEPAEKVIPIKEEGERRGRGRGDVGAARRARG
jgi:hypothetical protein